MRRDTLHCVFIRQTCVNWADLIEQLQNALS